MTAITRRTFASSLALSAFIAPRARAEERAALNRFAAEAARMKAEAVAAGDQPYGAVVIKDGAIVGYGPSRVVRDANPDAHAERVALWEAQARLGASAVNGAIIVSTSVPCSACQAALARAGIARMYFGADVKDGGAPRGARS